MMWLGKTRSTRRNQSGVHGFREMFSHRKNELGRSGLLSLEPLECRALLTALPWGDFPDAAEYFENLEPIAIPQSGDPGDTYSDADDAYFSAGSIASLLRRDGDIIVRFADGADIETLVGDWLDVGGVLEGYSRSETLDAQTLEFVSSEDAGIALDALAENEFVTWAGPTFFNPTTERNVWITDEIVVDLSEGMDPLTFFTGDLSDYRPLAGTNDQFIVTIAGGPLDTLLAANVIEVFTSVDAATPNFLQKISFDSVPNDAYYGEQWALNNTGQSGGVTNADGNVQQAWDLSKGTGVIVAVLDSGVQTNHPDLDGNISLNSADTPGNGIDDDGNGYIDDANGWDFLSNDNNPNPGSGPIDYHGTAVAGIIAAEQNNSIGVSGVAPSAKILPVRIGDSYNFVNDAGLAAAIYYAAGRTKDGNGYWSGGADVLNLSFSFDYYPTIATALNWATNSGDFGSGSTVVAASGNSATGYLGRAIDLDALLAPGTWTAWFVYQQNVADTAGYDTAWVSDIQLPGLGRLSLNSPSSVNGWSTFGSAPWSYSIDPAHAYGTGNYALQAGDLNNGQASALVSPQFTVSGSNAALQFRYWDILASSSAIDGMYVMFSNDGGQTFQGLTSLGSLPPSAVNPNIAFPANAPGSTPTGLSGVIAVGASTDADYRADYSNYRGSLDVVAPSSGGYGPGIRTTTTGSSYTDSFGGTSAATPYVAGVVALLLEQNPWLKPEQIRTLLRGSADKIGGVTYTSGYNQFYGYGRVDAEAALDQLVVDISDDPNPHGASGTFVVKRSGSNVNVTINGSTVLTVPNGSTQMPITISAGDPSDVVIIDETGGMISNLIKVNGEGELIIDDHTNGTLINYVGNDNLLRIGTPSGTLIDYTAGFFDVTLKTGTAASNVSVVRHNVESFEIIAGGANQTIALEMLSNIIVAGSSGAHLELVDPRTSSRVYTLTGSGPNAGHIGHIGYYLPDVMYGVTYSGVSTLELSTAHNTTNEVSVVSTPSGVSTELVLRGSNETVSVGSATSSVISSLLGSLDVNGIGAGTVTLNFNDVANTGSNTYAVEDDFVQVGTSSTIRRVDYDSVNVLNVTTGNSSGHQLNVNSTASLAQTNVIAGGAGQQISVGDHQHPLSFMQGPVDIVGNASVIVFSDEENAATTRSYTVTGTAITASGIAGPFTYSGADLLHLTLGDSTANTARVRSTSATSATYVNAHNSSQVITIGDTVQGLNQINSPTVWASQVNNPQVRIDDSASSTARTYTMQDFGVSYGGVSLRYADPSTLRMDLSTNTSSQLNIASTPDSPTYVEANGSNQIVRVGSTGTLDNINDPLYLYGGVVTLDDHSNSSSYAYDVSAPTSSRLNLSRTGGAQTISVQMEPNTSPSIALASAKLLLGTNSGSTARISGSIANTTTTVEAGHASQVISVGNTSSSGLGSLASQVTVLGGTIVIDDDRSGNTTNWTYDVTSTTVTRSPGAGPTSSPIVSYGVRPVNQIAVPSIELKMNRSSSSTAIVKSTSTPTKVTGGTSTSGQNINVGASGAALSAILHDLTLTGTAIDYTFDDRASTADSGVDLNATQAWVNGGTPRFSYANAATVSIKLASSSSTVNPLAKIDALPSAPVTVEAGGGQYPFVLIDDTVGAGSLAVVGGAGSTTVYMSDAVSSTGRTYAFGPGATSGHTVFTRTGGLSVDYVGVNKFDLTGGTGADTVTVNNPTSTITEISLRNNTGDLTTILGTLAGKTLSVDGTHVSLGNSSTSIANIKGNVSLLTGIANIAIHDEAASGAHTYDFLDDSTMTAFYRDFATANQTGKISLDDYHPAVTLTTNNSTNTFNIRRLDPNLTITAGSGNDTLDVNQVSSVGSLVFNAGSGTNTASIRVTSSGSITYNGAAGTDTVGIGNASRTLDEIGAGTLFVNGGSGGNLTMNVYDDGSDDTERELIDDALASPPTITRTDLTDGAEGEPQNDVVIKYTNVTLKNVYYPD